MKEVMKERRVRSASWRNSTRYCRLTDRGAAGPVYRCDFGGFRAVRVGRTHER